MTGNTINTEVTMRDEVPAGGAKRFRVGDEILGRYVVESELGQGGMGVVYLCLDKVGGIKVAVKGLPPEVSHNSDEMESVRENFQLVSELQHPNISGVRTLEKDEKTGDYYLVMAYARGVSLKHWLRQHGGKEHRVEQLKVLRQIAAALDYAHNAEPRHIIHRDIKPENVMVDERGNVSVLDFGLAAQVRSSLSRVSQVVTSRSGTPAYKSPEQWLAQAQRAPSDQYSLGVIAYQMFAGELPYDSDDIEILKHAIVFDSVPAIPSEGKAVNLVFAKVLAKKPQERFASCTAFVDALEGKKGVDAGAFARRPRFGLVVAGIAVLAAIAGGVWMLQCPRVQGGTGRTDPVASVDKPAPVMPLVKTQMVEKAVEKIVEKPIVTQVVEKVVPVAPARTDETADRRRQEEVAKLATMRTKISIKIAAAKDGYAKVSPYRSERAGFEAHLSEIDRQWATVERVRSPKTLAEAEKTLAAVTEAADAIAFELNWLATNRDGRDTAKRFEKEISDELDAKLREFKADDVAKSQYDKGQFERQAASAALSRGEFTSARNQYETAKATLSAALVEARQFHIKTAMAAATEYKNTAQWQGCLDEATRVLGWEPANADALAFKKEAESYLRPTLRFVAKVDGREVVATATFDGKPYMLPWRWEKDVCTGSRIPGSEVAVEYVEGGKLYVGTIKPVTVDWTGPKTVVVALAEYRGPMPGNRAGETTTIALPGGAKMEMVWCPPGSFMMGSPESEPCRSFITNEKQHRVVLTKGFWMGKYEVTQRQWESVMGENPSAFKSQERPVERVSWNDCQRFVRQINASGQLHVSLPTEAQWEYACRAGTTTAVPNEKDMPIVNYRHVVDDIAWHGENSDSEFDLQNGVDISPWFKSKPAGTLAGTHPVGKKKANFWGLHDAIGNVSEWCQDGYDENYYEKSPTEDPLNNVSKARRVVRGGSWYDTYHWWYRSSFRYGLEPDNRRSNIGFRLVCSDGLRGGCARATKMGNGDMPVVNRQMGGSPATNVQMDKLRVCDYCGGTGCNPCKECGPIRNQAGEAVCEHGLICSKCNGSGKRNSGFFTEPCSDCRGRGWERHVKCAGSGFLSGVCPKCKGAKTISAGVN